MGADKRRFTDSLEKLKKKHNIVTPELDDDKVRLAHKIKDLTLEEISRFWLSLGRKSQPDE